MARTSTSDPLPIYEVACGAGVIGMTYCPGKKGESVYGKAWDRDLDADLDIVEAWGARAVVTLVEDHELARLRVPTLGEEVEARGMDWLHVPIKDVSVPDAGFDRRWVYSGHVLRTALRDGGRILVHCRGGRGRTSIVTAKLLVELGATPAEAIARVRQAKSETFETQLQADYASRQVAIAHDEDYLNRVLGCLFGGAVGDAFGYAIEFKRLWEIRSQYGPAGLMEPAFDVGRFIVSDDTQMTLFTGAGLAKAFEKDDLANATAVVEHIRQAYQQWYATQTERRPSPPPTRGIARFAELWKWRASGRTCTSALHEGGRGAPESPINHSKGCGGVMRVAPIGLVRRFGLDEAFDLGARAAALTHGHPCGYLSAGTKSSLVRDLVGGSNRAAALDAARARLSAQRSHEETLAAIDNAMALSTLTDLDEAIRNLGEGWVGEEALAIALYAARRAIDFKDAVRIGANHDGDSDSTASIAAQIWGAEHGLVGVPSAWVRRLDVFDPLCEIAGELLSIDCAATEV